MEHQLFRIDILPALSRRIRASIEDGDSHVGILGFGVSDLILWGDLPRGCVEQADPGLCQAAGIPISPIGGESREYLLADVLGSVTVGVGGFARHAALPAIEAADYCEPALLVTGSPESTAEVAAEYDVPAIDYAAYGDGEAADRYDAVYVATPNALHLPLAEAAAALGKHVLCEKPLEATAERSARLVDACADGGVSLMTAYRLQTDPVVRRLRPFLEEDGLSRVTKLTGDFTYPVMGGSRSPDQWRLNPELSGEGALADVGIYPLNTARFLLGADATAGC
jgi:predicted dehydrogenase